MMAKDSVKKRIDGETGISYTEFAYQLMQGYDFYWLHKNKNCKLQFGGSDQWGNMTTGTELIRRKASGEAFVFTNPLITKSDGGKFGKTEQGNIWLDSSKTSAFHFYQFWLNAADTDAEKWIKIFTFLDKETIQQLTAQHHQDPSKRILQKQLAETVTLFIHGQEGLKSAAETTQKLFTQGAAPAESLSVGDLQNMDGIVPVDYPGEKLQQGVDVTSFLAETNIFPSKGEARKMIQNGGVSINRKKVDSLQLMVDSSLLLHEKFLLVQKGKKNYFLVQIM
jgi:tyrosyl-tRNA synthetase